MTRAEALDWTKANDLGGMRMSQARAGGVLPLWEAYMAALWDEDMQRTTPNQALREAVESVYPRKPKPATPGCGRCDGTGYIAAFAHVHGGRCLACNP